MKQAKRYFIFMTSYHQHQKTPEAKEDYALTTLQTFYNDPDCPDAIRARLLPILSRHALDREARSHNG